jgi:hypothetical protein
MQPIFVQLFEIGGVAATKLGSFRQLLQQTAAVTHDGHHAKVGLRAPPKAVSRRDPEL